MPPYKPIDTLDPSNPKVFGNLTGPDNYYELRHMIDKDNLRALDVMREADEEFYKIFGRKYGLVEEYRTDGYSPSVLCSSHAFMMSRSAFAPGPGGKTAY